MGYSVPSKSLKIPDVAGSPRSGTSRSGSKATARQYRRRPHRTSAYPPVRGSSRLSGGDDAEVDIPFEPPWSGATGLRSCFPAADTGCREPDASLGPPQLPISDMYHLVAKQQIRLSYFFYFIILR